MGSGRGRGMGRGGGFGRGRATGNGMGGGGGGGGGRGRGMGRGIGRGIDKALDVFRAPNWLRALSPTAKTQEARGAQKPRLVEVHSDREVQSERTDVIANKPPPNDGVKPDAIVVVDTDKCMGCGICTDLCPENAITVNDVAVVDPRKCVACGACLTDCPSEALSLPEPLTAVPWGMRHG